MKTFLKICAQGDVAFRRIDKLPDEVKEVTPVLGRNIVAHSETGHDHVICAERSKLYSFADSLMDSYLEVYEQTTLEHLRDFDTHEPILFEPGIYHVRRQREYTPEGFRRVED